MTNDIDWNPIKQRSYWWNIHVSFIRSIKSPLEDIMEHLEGWRIFDCSCDGRDASSISPTVFHTSHTLILSPSTHTPHPTPSRRHLRTDGSPGTEVCLHSDKNLIFLSVCRSQLPLHESKRWHLATLSCHQPHGVNARNGGFMDEEIQTLQHVLVFGSVCLKGWHEVLNDSFKKLLMSFRLLYLLSVGLFSHLFADDLAFFSIQLHF